MDPRGVKHRLESPRDMIGNEGHIVEIMTSQTLEVKQVSQCNPGRIMKFRNRWVY